MRIAHFLLGRSNPRSANGVDKTVYYLSQALASLGQDVGVFSVSDLAPVPVPGADVRTYAPRRLPSPRRSSPDGAGPRNPFSLPRGMHHDLLAWRPDVVHFHSVYIPEAVWIARRLRAEGIPYCVSPHGALLPESQRHRRRWRKQLSTALLEGRYLRGASFLHMVSGREAQELRARGPGPPLVVAHNGFDLSVMPERPDPALLLRQFPELRGKRVVGYLGRLDTGPKGLDLLLGRWAPSPNLSPV
jgi:glycosyltransferase involved in cell wall biosynthesis